MTTAFQRADDQQKAAREAFDSIFFNGDETTWLIADGRTADEARAIASNTDEAEWQPEVTLVKGWLGTKDSEDWFQTAADGPVEMWKVN